MESKKKCSYQAVLSYIKTQLLPNFNPRKILTDFETGLSKALQDNFPSAKRIGCWFHHNQVNKIILHYIYYLQLLWTLHQHLFSPTYKCMTWQIVHSE